jgi:pSer/pThr/pTyr-binding forkhead associated (FHA) protein
MPFQLVIIQGRGSSQTIRLGPGVTVVGRQPGCHLQVKSSQVSRKHCELFEKKGLLLVKDLGSSNGTFVNGKRVKEQLVIEPGAELSVGGVKFRVEKMAEAAGPAKGDSATVEPVMVADDDIIPVEMEEEPTAVKPATGDTDPTIGPGALPAAPKPAEPKAEEISEDAVADFLFNIELDDEDKV